MQNKMVANNLTQLEDASVFLNSKELENTHGELVKTHEKQVPQFREMLFGQYVPSEEFRHFLWWFYLFLSLYTLLLVINSWLEYNEGNMNINAFLLSALGSIAIYVWSIGLLIYTHRSEYVLQSFTFYFTLLSCIFIVFIVISDSRMINHLFGWTTYASYNCSLIFTVYILITRELIFCNFRALMTLLLFYSTFYLIAFAITAAIRFATVLAELLLAFVTVAAFIGNAYYSEKHAKFVFKDKELAKAENSIKRMTADEGNKFNTELEEILEKLNEGKATILEASTGVINEDIKNRLRNITVSMEKIRMRLASGGNYYSINLQAQISSVEQIDEEDRAFIIQNYQHTPSSDNTGFHTGMRHSSFKCMKTPATPSSVGSKDIHLVLENFGLVWNFDIQCAHVKLNHDISLWARTLCKRFQFHKLLNYSKKVSRSFYKRLEEGYKANPFHNSQHACDVTHSLLYFIENSRVADELTVLELHAALLSSLAHDVGHPGTTSRYLIITQDKLARRYNDQTVLENMHCSTVFEMMRYDNCDIFQGLQGDEWVESRKIVVEMILATEMSRHFDMIGRFRAKTTGNNEIDVHSTSDKLFLLQIFIKGADLGYAAKSINLHTFWTQHVWDEYFAQGDLEKAQGLPISMYCDRQTTNVAKSQNGFLLNICIPMFEAICGYLNSDLVNLDVLAQAKENAKYWEMVSNGVQKQIKAGAFKKRNNSKQIKQEINRRKSNHLVNLKKIEDNLLLKVIAKAETVNSVDF